MEKFDFKQNIKWAQISMAIFILLAMIFNSQSLVNYSKLWDVNAISIQAKNIVQIWNSKMDIIGANGPRKLIEQNSLKFKKLKFKKQKKD